MITLIIILVMLAVVLGIAFAVSQRGGHGMTGDDERLDRKYRDEDGDHLYYDESIIEKKEFRRRFPDVRGLRTFSRLFRNKN